MTTWISLGCLAPMLLFGLTACGSWKINYRLTLEVEVDGVIHTGSSVIETEWTHNPKWLQGVLNPFPGRRSGVTQQLNQRLANRVPFYSS